MNSNGVIRLFNKAAPLGQSILFGIAGAIFGDFVLSSCLWVFSFGASFSDFLDSVLAGLFYLGTIGTISGIVFHNVLPNSRRFWIFFIAAIATAIGFLSLAFIQPEVGTSVYEVRTHQAIVAILIVIIVRILVEVRRRLGGMERA